jgi:hypothetical protein
MILFFNVYTIAVLKSRKNLRKKKSWSRNFVNNFKFIFFNKKIKNRLRTNKSFSPYFTSFYYF